MISLIDGDLKRCSCCKEYKSLDKFHKDSSNRYGLAYNCKDCANSKSKQWHSVRENLDKRNLKVNQKVQQRKRKLVEQFGNKCHDCGNSFPDVCYDFHHIDETNKEFNPANGLKLSEERMLKELEKCILLCSNCHRIRHYDSSRGW